MKKLILTLSIVLFAGAAFASGSPSGCTHTNVDKNGTTNPPASTGSDSTSPIKSQTGAN